MNKKTLIIIAGTLVLIGVVAATIHKRQTVAEVSLGPVLATNIRFPDLATNDKVRFFSGSAFAEIDPGSTTAKGLTGFYRLPIVSDVKWGSNGALFLAGDYSPTDQLYNVLLQRNLPLDQPYWWYVNFADNSINLIGDGLIVPGQHKILDVVWQSSGNSFYYLVSTETPDNAGDVTEAAQQLYLSAPGVPDVFVRNLDAQSLEWSSAGKVVYVSAKDNTLLQKVDVKSGEQQTISHTFAGHVSVGQSGSDFVLTETSLEPKTGEELSTADQSGVLYYVSDAGDKEKISDGFSGSSVLSQSDWVALEASTTNGFTGNQTDVKSLKINAGKTKPDLLAVFGLLKKSVYITDSSQNLYVAGGAVQVSVPPRNQIKHGIIEPDKYSIRYDSSRDQNDVYVYGDTVSNSLLAIKAIQKLGLDPYQLNIKWYPTNGGQLTKGVE